MQHFAKDGQFTETLVDTDQPDTLRSFGLPIRQPVDLVTQLALFWLDDDRREMRRAMPEDERWMVAAFGD